MGRTPKPVKLKVLEGRGPGRSGKPRDSGGRAIPDTPAFRRMAPAKPKALSATAAAHWDEIVPELQRLELLSPVQIGGLTILCEAWAMHKDALKILKAEGLTIDTAQGKLRHPAVGIAAAAWREYRAWAAHFGLTPAAEGRVKPTEADSGEGNPFE